MAPQVAILFLNTPSYFAVGLHASNGVKLMVANFIIYSKWELNSDAE